MSEIKAQPKVFVSQYVRNLDFAEANQYGDVVFLSDEEYRPEPSVQRFNDSIANEIKNKMRGYIAGTDFIMTTGSSIPNVIVGSLLMKGEHKILKWSNQRKTYEVFKVRI